MKRYYIELTDVGRSHLAESEFDLPVLSGNEILVKTTASMISAGTELSRAFAIKKGFSYPVYPGYCSVGRVVAKAEDSNLEIGDKVFFNSPHASLSVVSNGNRTQGPCYMKLPDEISDFEATSINLGLVALQGVNLTDVKAGDRVAIFGLGNIGIITGLIYKKLGAYVLGLDFSVKRCDLAKEMGFDEVISSKDQSGALKSCTDQIDIAVDASGASPAIISAVNAVKKYGQVLLLGSPRASYECDITPVFSAIHMKNLKVIGAFNNTVPLFESEGSDASVQRNFRIIVSMILNKEIDVSKMITHIIDPKDCECAYYGLMYEKDEYQCVVMDWSKYGDQ